MSLPSELMMTTNESLTQSKLFDNRNNMKSQF